MRKATFALILMFATLSVTAFAQDEKPPEDKESEVAAAILAAEDWLAVVDSAGWVQSYTDAAQFFKSSVAEDVWIKQIRGVRMPLGRVDSRSLMGSQYAASLPGAPDGEYVVLRFKTTFENKDEAVETVTPMKDPDGQWRVSGYYLR
jgi:hypothetical protein